ncbi:MAG: hypothetical protein JKY08_07765 [Flavobacteriaceae bacterium]|nr:hypothetical protein [Flavobacteriaceae bacterium]
MNKYLLSLSLFSFFVISHSFSQGIEFKKGDTIHKEVILIFNDYAISNQEYITFEINKDFDFKNLTLLFNDVKTIDKIFKIPAKKNKEIVSFKFFLNNGAGKGNYKFSIDSIKPSSGFKNQSIKYVSGIKIFTDTDYIYPKTFSDILLYYLKIVGGVLLVIFIIYFILSRDNMPLGNKTFIKGMITYPDGQLATVRLEGQNRYQYNISNALSIDPGIILEPYDKYYNKKKRRFARLKNTSDAEIIIICDGIEESIGGAQELYNMDEVKIKTKDNRLFIINYTNRNNIRI